jgi:hypothetical protein
MGGAISAPAMAGLLNGSAAATTDAAWKPKFLTASQAALATEIADVIIPRTETPGAKDIGIAAFIDSMLNDVYSQQDQKRFVDGMASFAGSGGDFMKLDAKGRMARVRAENVKRTPFMMTIKELTLIGFFMSEPGMTQVLQHVPIPGKLLGCIPLSEAGNGKTWGE